MRIGSVIKTWRAVRDLNIRETAKSMGISAATLSRIERGENMDGESLAKIIIWSIGEDRPIKKTEAA